MWPTLKNKLAVVFDLDDTLCQEYDFLKSAFNEIAGLLWPQIDGDSRPENQQVLWRQMCQWQQEGAKVFDHLLSVYNLPNHTSQDLLMRYRGHLPSLTLDSNAAELLKYLQEQQVPLGLITDGYSLTQRNKLKGLGIESWFDTIIISEEFGSQKPAPANYLHFDEKYPDRICVYIGDNVRKDFITPNQQGWITIGLKDRGENVHSQPQNLEKIYYPAYWVDSLTDCRTILEAELNSRKQPILKGVKCDADFLSRAF